jgi:hypothetical protein
MSDLPCDVHHKKKMAIIRLILSIDDCLYFVTSDIRENFQKELVDRFNVDLQRLTHWYLAARHHQDNEFNVKIYQSIHAKSPVTPFLEAADIKKSNIPHGNILATRFIITSKDLTIIPEESSQIQEAYNLDHASCIDSSIYLSYT